MAAKTAQYLPTDWEDDDRMNFMFSAFPEQRHVNPKHWDSKLLFWTKTILESCQYHGNICVDLNELRQRFNRNGHVPLGLRTVISEMLKSRDLETVNDLQSGVNEGWVSWSWGIARKSVSWTMGTLLWGNDSTSNAVEGEKLVVVSVLKDKADSLLRLHYKSAEHETTDHIIPWNVLKARCSTGGLALSDTDLEMILCHLQKQKSISVSITPEGERVIKFAKKNQSKASGVIDADLDIMRLKKTMAVLSLQGKKLSNNIESCKQKAKTFVNQGLKKSALAVLKKRESYQKSLDRTMGNLHTLEELLHRIQESETDKMIVETLKSGSSALRAIQEGLSAKDADKVMMDVEETLEDAEDIQQALVQGNQSIAELTGQEDLDELERELEALSISIPAVSHTQPSPSTDIHVMPTVPVEVPMGAINSPTTPPHTVQAPEAVSPISSALSDLPVIPTHSPVKTAESDTKRQAKTALLG